MRPRVGASRRWVWLVYGLALCCFALTASSVVTRARAGMPFDGFVVVGSAYVLVQAALGAVIAARRPSNPIGWILVGASVLWATAGALGDAALAAVDPSQTWVSYSAWLAQIVFMPGIVVVPWVLPLVFPDGRLPSPRWRPVMWAGLVFAVGTMVASATAGQLPDYEGISPPFAVGGATADVMAVVNVSSWLGITFLTLLSVVPVVLRYRSANEVVREQMRWLLFAFGILAGCMAVAAAVFSFAPAVSSVALVLGLATLPAAMAIALVRHRLFDIDRLISRTVSYTIVTALLVGSYLAAVLTSSALARAVGGSSDLAVAASTLVVAALFQPVRRRVQGLVDRRFDRRRYDAARTVESFGVALRREVRIDRLAVDLQDVVARTVAPAHSSVWVVHEEGRG